MRDTGKNRSVKGVLTCVLFGAVLVFCVMGLGVLRFHSARLAYYLDSINVSIKQYSDEATMLKQELSALTAPVQIYSYCRESLGMEKVLTAEVLPMYNRKNRNNTYMASNYNNKNNLNEKQGWRKHFAWLFGE